MTDTLILRICVNHLVKLVSIILEEKEKISRGNEEGKDREVSTPLCLMRKNLKMPCIQAAGHGHLGDGSFYSERGHKNCPCTESRM